MKKLFLSIALFFAAVHSNGQWTDLVSGVTNTLRSPYFVDENTGWIVGEAVAPNQAIILKTTDGGSTWTSQVSGTTNALRGVHFLDASTGIAVGFSGTILRTTDGGSTWGSIASGTTQPLRSVYFTNETTGYAVGGAGTAIKTTDGGLTWTALSSGITVDLIQVRFYNDEIGYATSSNGTFLDGRVIKTTDGGATWSTVYSNASVGMLGLAVVDENTAYAGGGNETIIRTTDGGATWDEVYVGTIGYNIRGGQASSNGEVRLCTWNILKSSDGGENWEVDHYTGVSEYLGIFFVNDYLGFACGSAGGLAKYYLCPDLAEIENISGPSAVCSGDTVVYSIFEIPGAENYYWEVPEESSIIGGEGTNEIQMLVGTNEGSISVFVSNDCDSSATVALNVVVNITPPVPVITFTNNELSSSATTGNQWYLNGVEINGAVGQTYVPTQNGTYTVTVTQDGCSSTSEPFEVVGVGFQPLTLTAGLSVFPNPMAESATVTIEASAHTRLLITDLQGRVIRSIEVNSNVIRLERDDLQAGYFLIRLVNQSNQVLSLTKLIIQ
jgi:photosystem II stability/assembly factor-like uncharacterized protein